MPKIDGIDYAEAQCLITRDRSSIIYEGIRYCIEPDANDHLDTLRMMRKRIHDEVSGDCSSRDLASLSRRLQDVSREITTLEDKQRQENREASGGTNRRAEVGNTKAGDRPFSPSGI